MQVRTIAYYHWIFPAGGAETVTCNLGRFFETQGLRQSYIPANWYANC